MKVYLIRHAQSWNNALPEEDRVEDPGLTELGTLQAQRLAERIAELELTRLYVSPFLRTLLTAAPLASATGLSPHVRIDIHEVGGCYGGYGRSMVGRPGMNRREIMARFPSYNFHDDLPEEGWWGSRPRECHDQAAKRARQVMAWLQSNYGATDHRVGIVTHADFKSSFLEQFHPEFLETPYNTSVTTLSVEPQSIQLVTYNQVSHLEKSQLTF